jgi:hypothetical protein
MMGSAGNIGKPSYRRPNRGKRGLRARDLYLQKHSLYLSAPAGPLLYDPARAQAAIAAVGGDGRGTPGPDASGQSVRLKAAIPHGDEL